MMEDWPVKFQMNVWEVLKDFSREFDILNYNLWFWSARTKESAMLKTGITEEKSSRECFFGVSTQRLRSRGVQGCTPTWKLNLLMCKNLQDGTGFEGK